jgi:hypothetical protein
MNPRPMYYSQIRIDPTEPQIYVLARNCGVRRWRQAFRDDGAPGVHLDHHTF